MRLGLKLWIVNEKEMDKGIGYIYTQVGGRYGSINSKDPDERSYTNMEYDYAYQPKKHLKF